MQCKHLKIRSKKYQRYFYCSFKKQKVQREDCCSCSNKEYKKVSSLKRAEIKKKSKKMKKLEANRYSIITDNLEICHICKIRKKQDLHEIFGGCNRRKSIEFGLIVPICRLCHSEIDTNEEMKKTLQDEEKRKFKEIHKDKSFLKEFGKDYLKMEEKEKWNLK